MGRDQARLSAGTLLSLTLSLGGMACASPRGEPATPEAAATEPTATQRTLEIAPGKFAELNLIMPVASHALAEFTASGPIAWDVHTHAPDGTVSKSVEGTGHNGTMRVTAAHEGGHSLLWMNEGDTAVTLELTVTLDPGVRIDSWVP